MKHKLYRFAVPDIAKAAGVTEEKVRRDIRSGRFVPGSLKELAAYVASKMLEKMK